MMSRHPQWPTQVRTSDEAGAGSTEKDYSSGPGPREANSPQGESFSFRLHVFGHPKMKGPVGMYLPFICCRVQS